jgi:hypothetical protein
MARDLDHLVSTHQHAAQLRREGKPIWKCEVPVRTIFNANRDKSAPTIALLIAAQLRTRFTKQVAIERYDEDFDGEIYDVVYRLEDIGKETMPDANTTDWFDDVLDDLYDWADHNRVWLS